MGYSITVRGISHCQRQDTGLDGPLAIPLEKLSFQNKDPKKIPCNKEEIIDLFIK